MFNVSSSIHISKSEALYIRTFADDDFVRDAAFQGCPCPMQLCPKNVDTGALIGNGKGAPVISGTGPSLPPSALVGPPSPARGLAGLAPPHGANAWDTDRVQLNAHRNLNQNQVSVPPSHNLVGGHSRPESQDCRSKVRIILISFTLVGPPVPRAQICQPILEAHDVYRRRKGKITVERASA